MATQTEVTLNAWVKRLEREIRIIRAKELETECPPVKFIVEDDEGCESDCDECWTRYMNEVKAGRGSLCREKRINSNRTVR